MPASLSGEPERPGRDPLSRIAQSLVMRLRERAKLARSIPPNPPTFRAEADRLVRSFEEERLIPRKITNLGISSETLRTWHRLAKIDAGERKGLTTEEREKRVSSDTRRLE